MNNGQTIPVDSINHPRTRVGNTKIYTIIEQDILFVMDESCAIILQRINDWMNRNLEKGECVRDNRVWVYRSLRDLHDKEFPYWSHTKIIRNIKWLVDKGFLIKNNTYNQWEFDHTNWYTVNYEALDDAIEKAKTKYCTEHNISYTPPSEAALF